MCLLVHKDKLFAPILMLKRMRFFPIRDIKLEPIDALGKRLEVEVVEARLRNGYASIKNGKVVIRIPIKYSRRRKLKIVNELYSKISKAIAKKPASFLGNEPLKFWEHRQDKCNKRLDSMGFMLAEE